MLTRGSVPGSGGFSTSGVRTFLRDLPSVPHYLGYLRTLKAHRRAIDLGIVVGDVFLLLLGRLGLRRKLVFVALAKSDWDAPHSPLERTVLRRLPQVVFARDERTRAALERRGVRTLHVGNPLMDGLSGPEHQAGGPPMVALLPGSRREACDNLLMMLDAVERVRDGVVFRCALPATLQASSVAVRAATAGWGAEAGELKKDRKVVTLVEDGFERVIAEATVVVGLAGTANEQAAGLGKPVVAFVGSGPQTTATRWRSQRRLLGEALAVVTGGPDRVAAEVEALVADPAERARRGHAGACRMGPPGGAARIAEWVIGEFMS